MRSNPNQNSSASSTMQSRLFNPVKISLSTHSSSISTSESNSSPETNLKLTKQNSLRNPSLVKNKILNSNQNSSNIDFVNHFKNEIQQTTSKLKPLNSNIAKIKSIQQPQKASSSTSSVFKNQVNFIPFIHMHLVLSSRFSSSKANDLKIIINSMTESLL